MIPPFEPVPVPLTDEAAALPWFQTAEDEIGQRHRLGGWPEFIQAHEVPKCSCEKDMTFYAQLDSINDEFSLGNCGLIYVFVCFECFETKALLRWS